MTNCNPPYVRGTGCCKCCPPESCDNVRITFTLYKNNCPSSSSSSSSSAAPILTECCPEDYIPAVLNLTILNLAVGCECLDFTLQLTYQELSPGLPGEYGWFGFIDTDVDCFFGDLPHAFRLRCNGGVSWTLEYYWGSTSSDWFTDQAFIATLSLEDQTCAPFTLTGLTSMSGSRRPCNPGGTFTSISISA